MNKGLSIFKRAQHLQGGDSNFDPGKWADPGALPSPPPDPNVYINRWPGNFTSPGNYTPPMNIPLVPPGDYNFQTNTGSGYTPYMSDQQMINQLGYDPGDPRNDLTRGFNSGVPTQRGIGTGVSALSNMFVPGSGFVTGPAASWATRWLQGLFGQNKVQNATQPYQQGQQQPTQGSTDTGDGTDTTGTGDSGGTTPTTPKTPTAGVGIDPTGNPAQPGQWWSPDFGRWTGYDQYGTTPGSYNLTGPGGGMGQRGTGFGAGTVGNLATAIGLDSLGRGGGGANFGGGFGNVANLQLRHIAKGIFGNDPNPEGIGALYEMTGTHAPSAGQYQQSQQQLQNILQSNPSLMSGPTSGPMLRGGSRIPLETVQTGSSDIQQNPGLRLFMATAGLRKPKVKKPKI